MRQILIILQKHTSLIPPLMLALVPMLAWTPKKVRIILRSHQAVSAGPMNVLIENRLYFLALNYVCDFLLYVLILLNVLLRHLLVILYHWWSSNFL